MVGDGVNDAAIEAAGRGSNPFWAFGYNRRRPTARRRGPCSTLIIGGATAVHAERAASSFLA
jgi:hypothetical protein